VLNAIHGVHDPDLTAMMREEGVLDASGEPLNKKLGKKAKRMAKMAK